MGRESNKGTPWTSDDTMGVLLESDGVGSGLEADKLQGDDLTNSNTQTYIDTEVSNNDGPNDDDFVIRPQILTPTANETITGYYVATLSPPQVGPFMIGEHIVTTWEVANSNTFIDSTKVFVSNDNWYNKLSIPLHNLQDNTTYYIRARYGFRSERDIPGNICYSMWSATVSFNTGSGFISIAVPDITPLVNGLHHYNVAKFKINNPQTLAAYGEIKVRAIFSSINEGNGITDISIHSTSLGSDSPRFIVNPTSDIATKNITRSEFIVAVKFTHTSGDSVWVFIPTVVVKKETLPLPKIWVCGDDMHIAHTVLDDDTVVYNHAKPNEESVFWKWSPKTNGWDDILGSRPDVVATGHPLLGPKRLPYVGRDVYVAGGRIGQNNDVTDATNKLYSVNVDTGTWTDRGILPSVTGIYASAHCKGSVGITLPDGRIIFGLAHKVTGGSGTQYSLLRLYIYDPTAPGNKWVGNRTIGLCYTGYLNICKLEGDKFIIACTPLDGLNTLYNITNITLIPFEVIGTTISNFDPGLGLTTGTHWYLSAGGIASDTFNIIDTPDPNLYAVNIVETPEGGVWINGGLRVAKTAGNFSSRIVDWRQWYLKEDYNWTDSENNSCLIKDVGTLDNPHPPFTGIFLPSNIEKGAYYVGGQKSFSAEDETVPTPVRYYGRDQSFYKLYR